MALRLSILICSLVSRAPLLERLKSILTPQLTDQVEVLYDIDNGEKIIGQKRNDLLERAQGDYICFIDDDDTVSNDYVSKILRAIETNPDCCGIEGVMTTNGRNPRRFIHSLRYNSWYEKDGVYYRNPNHLNPIRREIAIQVRFILVNKGEDSDFSKNILPLLKSEVYINSMIYNYLFIDYDLRNSDASIEEKPFSNPLLNHLREKARTIKAQQKRI